MNGKKVIKQLEKEGWRLIRIAGSHHILQKDGESVSIPMHGNKDLARGTLAAIERATGVKLK